MKKCPYCNFNLNFIQLKCPICRNYVWRISYTIVGGLLTLIIGTGAFIVIDYLAANRVPDKPEQGVINIPASQNPNPGGSGAPAPRQRSNPNHPRPADKKHF